MTDSEDEDASDSDQEDATVKSTRKRNVAKLEDDKNRSLYQSSTYNLGLVSSHMRP